MTESTPATTMEEIEEMLKRMEELPKSDKNISIGIPTGGAFEYMDAIEGAYKEAKLKKLSRMSIEWGSWSRRMNLKLRKQIESGKDPEELRLKYVFILWTMRSRLLELHYKSPYFGMNKRKKLSKECREIKNIIVSPITLIRPLEDFKDLADRIIT